MASGSDLTADYHAKSSQPLSTEQLCTQTYMCVYEMLVHMLYIMLMSAESYTAEMKLHEIEIKTPMEIPLYATLKQADHEKRSSFAFNVV